MNELQLSLLAIGAVVVISVLAFNRWQERKFRRQAEQRFPSQHDDVLLNETVATPERVEPVLDNVPVQGADEEDEPVLMAGAIVADEPATLPPVEAAVEEMEEPVPARTPVAQPVAAVPEAAADAPDAATEYVAMLSAGDPVSARALVQVLQQLRGSAKPLRWLGQCDRQQTWGEVAHAAPGTEYVKLAACLQLADRNGPVGAAELDAFCDMAQAVAANLYAVIDCPDKAAALATAAELDQFCADVDVLIGINLISKDGSPIAGTKLRGLAESAGMKLAADGNFHYVNDQGAELFALGNLEPTPFAAESMKHLSTHGVTFLFDVPKAAGGAQAFNQMLLTLKQFTGPLGALMVDDNRRELTDTGIDKIRQQLMAIFHNMEQHGTPAGGARARRLFA